MWRQVDASGCRLVLVADCGATRARACVASSKREIVGRVLSGPGCHGSALPGSSALSVQPSTLDRDDE
jgi:N-acetylglucosamine kinase-like BadF-type ATPase